MVADVRSPSGCGASNVLRARRLCYVCRSCVSRCRRWRVCWAILALGASLAACTRSPGVGTRADGEGAAWWVLEEEGARLADAGTHPTGGEHEWTLEYVVGGKTLQVVSFDDTASVREMTERSPVVGEAMVEGFKVTLRRFPGVASDGILPSVGADWTDGAQLMQFGGGGLSEDELRSHLPFLRRVDGERFQREVDRAQQDSESPDLGTFRPPLPTPAMP